MYGDSHSQLVRTRRSFRSRVCAVAVLGAMFGAVAALPAAAQEGAAPVAEAAPVAPPAQDPAPPAPPVVAPSDAGVVPAQTPSTPAATGTKKPRTKPKRKRTSAGLATSVPRGGTSVEVDISSQRLHIYKGGKLYRSVSVSTGSGRRYCSGGRCSIARTPRGRFRVYNRINGWRTAQLGRLYNPLYFRGGFAIHGGNLPGYPASHGCVRVSMSVARWLPSVIPNGASVWIHD